MIIQWYDKLFIAGMALTAIGSGMAIWGFAAMLFDTRR